MKALNAAIYGLLSGDSTLMGLATGGVHAGIAAQSASPPYVVYQEIAANDGYTFKQRVEIDWSYQIKAIATPTTTQSEDEVADDIMARVDTVLNDSALSVSGYRLGVIRRQSTFALPIIEESARYWQSGARYRIVLIPL